MEPEPKLEVDGDSLLLLRPDATTDLLSLKRTKLEKPKSRHPQSNW